MDVTPDEFPPSWTPADIREDREERAAIMEHCAGLDRAEAERRVGLTPAQAQQ